MKLAFHVDPPSNGQAYKPAEEVRGSVELQLAVGQAVPQIQVSFQGVMQVSIICRAALDVASPFPDGARRSVKRTLFHETTSVSPKMAVTKDNVCSGRTTYSAPFAFCFPEESSCCRASTDKDAACPLPPTLRFRSSAMAATVAYTLTATARRPGFWSRRVRTRQTLRLVPAPSPALALARPDSPSSDTDIPNSPPSLVRSTAHLPIDALCAPCKKDDLPLDGLPPYSPALALEVVLPHPALLCPGGPVDLGVFVHVPQSLLDTGGLPSLQLRTVQATLCCTTRGRVSGGGCSAGSSNSSGVDGARAETTQWPLWSVQGRLPLRQARLRVACGAWGSMLSLPAAAAAAVGPGFRTCCLSQAYSLEVCLGVSTAASSGIQYVTTAVDVMVSEPPPDYGREADGET